MKKAILFVVMMGLAGSVCAADDEASKKILKDAIVGAVTGAVAVEATKEDSPSTSAAAPATVITEASNPEHHHDGKRHPKKNFHKKDKKDKKRPHGWDMGKKTGWGDGNEPPGLRDKDR